MAENDNIEDLNIIENEEEKEKKEENQKEEFKALEVVIEELQKEKEELKDKYLRALANYENLRKRAIEEKEKIYNFTLEEVFKKILPLLDDFKRAFKALNNSKYHKDDYKAFVEGIRLIEANFKKLLDNYGVEPFSSTGERFDPLKHEAIHVMEKDGEEEGKILEETEPGYKIRDKILRPAKVIVAKKSQEFQNNNKEENKNQGGNSA
jgi:molecular chaperone GrpE